MRLILHYNRLMQYLPEGSLPEEQLGFYSSHYIFFWLSESRIVFCIMKSLLRQIFDVFGTEASLEFGNLNWNCYMLVRDAPRTNISYGNDHLDGAYQSSCALPMLYLKNVMSESNFCYSTS